MEVGYRQLSTGRRIRSSEHVSIPGMGLEWNDFHASILFWECLKKPRIWVALVLAAERPPVLRKQDVGPDDCLVYPLNRESVGVVHAGTRDLIINIDSDLIGDVDWKRIGLGPFRLPTAVRKSLVSKCENLRIQAMDPDRKPGSPICWLAAREAITTILRPFLSLNGRGSHPERPKDTRITRASKLVSRAETIFSNSPPDRQISVPDLADRLDVSTRTLFRMFNFWTGSSPNEYQMGRRLHSFRSGLLTATCKRGAVRETAKRYGFDHISRMIEQYSKLYGETPGQTLIRRHG